MSRSLLGLSKGRCLFVSPFVQRCEHSLRPASNLLLENTLCFCETGQGWHVVSPLCSSVSSCSSSQITWQSYKNSLLWWKGNRSPLLLHASRLQGSQPFPALQSLRENLLMVPLIRETRLMVTRSRAFLVDAPPPLWNSLPFEARIPPSWLVFKRWSDLKALLTVSNFILCFIDFYIV